MSKAMINFSGMISIILVEDITDYRQALKVLFNNTQGFCCLADYASAEDCLNNNAFTNADVAIVDLQLPGVNGIELITRCRQAHMVIYLKAPPPPKY